MIQVVVGGQFGSEAKGAVTAWLAAQGDPERMAVVRVAGPNAGHTVIGYGPDGPKHAWRLRQVPAAAVSNKKALLVIAAGSEIDLQVLNQEIDHLDRWGYEVSNRLYIDEQATIISDRHKQQEADLQMHERIGSTAKGIGAARASRIMRDADLYGGGLMTWVYLQALLEMGYQVIIEGTQGYGLGLHTGHYPQCTSSDCRAIDFLSMVGLSPWADYVDELRVWVVARTHPIRVAGNSGPMQGETSWDQLGLDPELTTVTQKVRRVGEWDPGLVRMAVEQNGGAPVVRVALTMMDHVLPEIAGAAGLYEPGRNPEVDRWVAHIRDLTNAQVDYIGTGPNTALIREGI